jgi:hypothetical protein
MASWRDMSTPLTGSSSSASAPTPAAAPTGGGWRDQSTPLAQPAPAAPTTAGAAAAPPTPASAEPGGDWIPGSVWLRHMGRVLDDATTFGVADKLGDLPGTGTNVAAERAKTAAASQDVGPIASTAAQIAGYVGGAGELGAATKIGEAAAPYVGGRLASVLGSGAEGALASGAGALGHGQDASDATKAAAIGGALGGGMGALGGVVGRDVATAAPPSPAGDLMAQAKTAYAPLSNVLYDASKEVHPTLDPIDAQNALRDWSGYKWGDASKTSKEVNTLLDRPQLSANDLQQSQSYLKGIARNPTSDPNDQLYAGHYAGKLQDILDNATPQTGVPQNWTPPPTPNVNPPAAGQGTMTVNGQPYKYAGGQWTPPSFAATQKAAGDALFQRAKDAGRLDNFIQASQVNNGPDVATQARSYLTSGKGQTFAPPGSSQYDAFNAIAGTTGKGGSIPYWVKHYMIAPTIGAGIGGGVGAVTGDPHSPWTHALEDAVIGAGIGGLGGSYGGASAGLNQAAQQRAINAARSTFASGAPVAPLGAPAPFRDAARKLLFGLGAAGNY